MSSSTSRCPQLIRFAGFQTYWRLLTSVSDRSPYTRRSIGTQSRTSPTGYSINQGEIDDRRNVLVRAHVDRGPAIIRKRPPGILDQGIYLPGRPVLGQLDHHRGSARSNAGGRAVDENQRWKGIAGNQGDQEAAVHHLHHP